MPLEFVILKLRRRFSTRSIRSMWCGTRKENTTHKSLHRRRRLERRNEESPYRRSTIWFAAREIVRVWLWTTGSDCRDDGQPSRSCKRPAGTVHQRTPCQNSGRLASHRRDASQDERRESSTVE